MLQDWTLGMRLSASHPGIEVRIAKMFRIGLINCWIMKPQGSVLRAILNLVKPGGCR